MRRCDIEVICGAPDVNLPHFAVIRIHRILAKLASRMASIIFMIALLITACRSSPHSVHPISVYSAHPFIGAVTSVAFSPKGDTIVVASSTPKLLSAKSGKMLGSFEGIDAAYYCCTFSPDGKSLAYSGWDGVISIANVKTFKITTVLKGHTSSVYAMAYSRDGTLLATGGHDNTTRVWDVRTGKLVHVLTGFSRSVSCLDFSPDGKLLATGDNSSSVKLWETLTAKLIGECVGHQGMIRGIQFSHDGQLLISGSNDKTIKVWDVATLSVRVTFNLSAVVFNALAVSPDGELLAAGCGEPCEVNESPGTVELWQLRSGRRIANIKAHNVSVQSIAFSPCGSKLLTGSRDGTISLWSLFDIKEQ